jgi:Tol biopolymer transport system component
MTNTLPTERSAARSAWDDRRRLSTRVTGLLVLLALGVGACGDGGVGEYDNSVTWDTADTAPDWSPDGQTIAFTSDRNSIGIYLLRSDGSGFRRVFSGYARNVDWAPDGQKLAFEGRRGIELLDPDEGRVAVVLEGAAYSHPAWAPNGELLAVVKEEPGTFTYEGDTFRDKAPAIYVVRPDGTDLHRLLPRYDGAVRDAVAGSISARSETGPSWSPNGDRIAFEAGDGEIVVADIDTGDRVAIDPSSYGHSPEWSPDGRHIAFACLDGLCVAPADGEGSARLLTPLDAANPSWAPDSNEIVFQFPLYNYKRETAHPSSLLIVSVDGGKARRLTHGPSLPSEAPANAVR